MICWIRAVPNLKTNLLGVAGVFVEGGSQTEGVLHRLRVGVLHEQGDFEQGCCWITRYKLRAIEKEKKDGEWILSSAENVALAVKVKWR